MATKRCDVGFDQLFFVSVVNKRWCGHQHATRAEARACETERALPRCGNLGNRERPCPVRTPAGSTHLCWHPRNAPHVCLCAYCHAFLGEEVQ
jgi:hypothetical protein